MRISCIIPTCNRNDFLVEAINSVLDQSMPPDEILVINNGSDGVNLPDNILQKINVYDLVPFAGVSQARNFGASIAKSDYLAFLDDDDLWCNYYLEKASTAIKNGAECVVSRLDKMENRKITNYKNIDNKLNIDNLLVLNPGVNGSNIVISKKLFYKIGGFDVKLLTGEDKALLIEIIKLGENIKTLSDNQAILRVHSKGRLSGAKTISEGIFQFTRKYRDLMSKKIYIFNLLKMYKYRIDSGEKSLILIYLFLKIIYLMLSVF